MHRVDVVREIEPLPPQGGAQAKELYLAISDKKNGVLTRVLGSALPLSP
jgi:hypothetical protein